MYFNNLDKIRLYNLLLKAKSEHFKLSGYSFDTEHAGAALEVNAAAERFYLQVLDYSVLKTLPAFAKEELELDALDENLKLAGIEILLQDTLQSLGRLCEANIVISQYHQDFKAPKPDLALSFEFELAGMMVPCVLYAHSVDAMQALSQKAELALSKITADNEEQQRKLDAATLPLDISAALGRCLIRAADFKGLKEGDAVVLDECWLAQNELQLIAPAAKLCARALVQNNEITLLEIFHRYRELTMSETNAINTEAAGSADSQSTDLTALDSISLEAVFELDRQSYTLQELKELQEGSVLPLKNRDLTEVCMLINGQKAALGRIIEAGDCFAFQITRLPKHE